MALGSDAGDTAFFCVAALLLSAVLAWVLRSLARCEGRRRTRAAVAALRRALSSLRGAGADDEVGRIVQSKVQEQTVQQFRSTCAVGAFPASLFTAFVVVHIVTGQERFFTAPQEVVHLALQGVLTLILVRPEVVTWRTIDVFYVFITVGFSAVVAPFLCAPTTLMMNIVSLDFGISILAVSRRNPLVTVPTSGLYAISSSATIWRHGAACMARPLNLALGHFVLVMFLPFAGHLLKSAIETLLRQAIEMETTKELLIAACGLLRSVCDVVVELDAAGTVTGSAHDLGTFLLRGPDFAQQKHRLADFISKDEDKKMFERRLHAQTLGTGVAEALHVHMKDRDRNVLKVEVLSFKFMHLDGRPRFMVGLRDYADSPGPGGRAQRAPGDAAEEAAGTNGGAPGALSDPGSDHESEAESVLSRTSLDAEKDPMRAVVTIDTTSERALVRGLSAGFQMRVGRMPPGTCLLDRVEPAKQEHFAKWLRAAARYGSVWPVARINLHLRQGRIRASFKVFQEKEDDSIDPERVEFLVIDIKRIDHAQDELRKAPKPYTDFRGTPSQKTLHMAL